MTAGAGSPTPASVRIPGFDYRLVDAGDVEINCAVGGSGPPVLLLHGYPQTHLIWRDVAPALARTYTVVATDLRGYGDSGKPAPATDSSTYAKTAMAADQVTVMARLGFERFCVVSHDRGARVAHRLTLDRPDVVERLVVMDIVPTRHVLRHADLQLGLAYFHWFFLAQDSGVAEHLLGLDPEYWVRLAVDRLSADGAEFDPSVVADYVRCFADAAAIAASCADHRAAATVDLADDDASFLAGERISCPTLVLWGDRGYVGRAYQPLDVWREYADDVRGTALPSGHYVPEEAPAEVVEQLRGFLGAGT